MEKRLTPMMELISELRQLAHNKVHHIGLGDIRITQGQIDELETKFLQKEKTEFLRAHKNGQQQRCTSAYYYENTFTQTFKTE